VSADRRTGDAVLLAELAGGATLQQAAGAARVSAKTVSRRLRDPVFAGQLREARRELVGTAVSRLAASATAAVDELRALLGSPSDAIRLRAAQVILETGNRLLESQDLVERLAAIEGRLEEAGQ
jgi:hypothetical protein